MLRPQVHFGHRSLDATGFEAGDLDAEQRQLHAEVSGEVLNADFDVGYAEAMGMVMYTDPDVVLMIRPLDARSSGVIACTTCTGPQKFTSNARRYSVIDAASITPSAASTQHW